MTRPKKDRYGVRVKWNPRAAPIQCSYCNRLLAMVYPLHPRQRSFRSADVDRKLRGKKCPRCDHRIQPIMAVPPGTVDV